MVTENPKIVLTGKPASKGIASGTARYIHSAADVDFYTKTFKEGDILLAPMTDIDYLPIMRKAKAVLTSSGGRFCHAAIICAELKKPCVVGTGSDIGLMDLNGRNITVNGSTGEIMYVKSDDE